MSVQQGPCPSESCLLVPVPEAEPVVGRLRGLAGGRGASTRLVTRRDVPLRTGNSQSDVIVAEGAAAGHRATDVLTTST